MKTLCLNRINKDIKEINSSPLEGIGIISLDNDPMKYIVNIRIMAGIYEGYCLQLLSSFLLQVQNFLSEPDISKDHLPNEEKIKELMKSMDNYERIFTIKDNNEEIIKIHTWKNPYPEIYYKNGLDKKKKSKNKEKNYLNKIKENLTCYISKINYIDDNNILLGYPIKKSSSGGLIPIPQILSYDSFIEEEMLKKNVSQNINDFFIIRTNIFEEEAFNFPFFQNDNNFFFRNRESLTNNYGSYKSANNEYYDSWLPIFINEAHFQKNKTTILNYFSILKFGNSGLKKYDFHTKYIFEIMPNILSEMIQIMAKDNISSSFLKCFFQYFLLYKKLIEKNKNFFSKYQEYYLNYNINIIINKDEDIDTNKLLLELFILLFSDNKMINFVKLQKLRNYLEKIKNLICFELFDNNFNFDFENPNLFVDDLKRQNLFYKIVDIIFIYSDCFFVECLEISEILRNAIIEKMEINFKELFKNLKYEIKQKIKKLIINNLDFSKYFNLNSFFSDFLFSPYVKFNHHQSFYDKIYLFFILRGKILEKNFLKNLENNYGIFFQADKFIEEIKIQLKDTNKIKQIIDKNKFLYNIFLLQAYNNYHNYYFFSHKKRRNEFSFCHRNMSSILSEKELYILIKKEKEDNIKKNKKMIFSKKEPNKEKIKRKKIKIKKTSNKINNNKYKKNYR